MRGNPVTLVARGLRALGLLGCLALTFASGLRAEYNESLTRFWLQEQTPRPEPRRHIVRPPSTNGARRSSFTVERRAAPEVEEAKPTIQPGFVVAVFGDLFGATIARGLSGAGALPNTAVIDQTGDDGELTRSGIEVWRAALDAATSKYGRIDAAILMLGADEIGITGKPGMTAEGAEPEGWGKAYGDQVEQLAATFRDKHVPLIWVGLPPVRDDEEARRFLDLNAVVHERAVKAGAIYVDPWEAFTDENGAYTPIGPEVDGQPAKLRRGDGRTFTSAGARKLASFVESDLKRIRDGIDAAKRLAAVAIDDQRVFDQALQIDVNAEIRREAGLPPLARPAVPEVDGPVVSLTAAPMAAGGRLATLYDADGHLTDLAAKTLDKGLAPGPRPGRTDDFSWPKP